MRLAIHSKRLVITTGIAVLAVAVPQAISQDRGFEDSTDVVLVQIPVHVTRDGEPVRGLTASNFEVLEGRKKRQVVAVDVYDLSLLPAVRPAGQTETMAPAGRRHFAMLFDLSNSTPAGIVRAREAAFEVATKGLHPSDLVAVATYSQSRGIDVLMGFSSDRLQLDAALAGLGLADPFERLNDPLKLSLIEYEESTLEAGAGGRPMCLQAPAQLVQQLADLSVLRSRSTRDQAKQQILDLAGNLDGLARLMSGVPGRKQIVLFSQGFDSEVVFGTQDKARIEEIMRSVQFGQTWQVDSEERFGASDAQGSLLRMLEQFNRSNAAVHTVDVGGLAAGGEAAVQRAGGQDFGGSGRLDRGHDGLALMARETGGEFYRNFNNLGEAMDDLLHRTSVTYVISVDAPQTRLDGSYRPIKVRLKGVRKGAKVSHRPGYHARRAFADLDPMERQMATAEQVVAGQPGGRIATEILAAAFRGPDRSNYVLTAIEIDGPALVADQEDHLLPAEVYTYAFDDRGRIRDYFTQAVALDLGKVGSRLRTGFKLLSHLELPPGRYEVRSLVRNVRTGASGLSVTQLSVPDFKGPTLLPPFFIEPEDHWLVAMEERQVEDEARYPLMLGDEPIVPASRPRLVSGLQIPFLLVGYQLPPELEAEGRLIAPDGKVHDEVVIEIDRRRPDRGEGEHLTAMLLAGSIQPGDYRLVVTVRGDGKEASSSVPVSFLPGT